jgi:hypothetical protein
MTVILRGAGKLLLDAWCDLAAAGIPPDRWLGLLLAAVEPHDERAYMTLLRVGHTISWGSDTHALRHIQAGAGDEAPAAVALHLLLKHGPALDVQRLPGAPVLTTETLLALQTIQRLLQPKEQPDD